MRGHCHERGEKKANKYPEEKEIDIIWDILRKKGLMFLQTVKLPEMLNEPKKDPNRNRWNVFLDLVVKSIH